jgi:hemolysin-activating ACP:hemolysin acyltransferase
MIGLTTWALLTEEEGRTGTYYGPEAFARDSGDQLWVMDQILPAGKRQVIQAVRDLRTFFYDAYPEYPRVYAWRGPRSTSYPNKG